MADIESKLAEFEKTRPPELETNPTQLQVRQVYCRNGLVAQTVKITRSTKPILSYIPGHLHDAIWHYPIEKREVIAGPSANEIITQRKFTRSFLPTRSLHV